MDIKTRIQTISEDRVTNTS